MVRIPRLLPNKFGKNMLYVDWKEAYFTVSCTLSSMTRCAFGILTLLSRISVFERTFVEQI